MDRTTFEALEAHMLSLMSDAAHDSLHVYRVLYMAMDLAAAESSNSGPVDMDVLIAACLLHDIGREAQFRDPGLCHAREGAGMAHAWLLEQGWPADRADHIRDCISTHRYRGDNPPVSLEAKILFDADKLDATGTMAIARSILYQAVVGTPLYCLDDNGNVCTGADSPPSLFREYSYKLRNVYGRFCTERGRALAEERRAGGEQFYESLLREARQSHEGSRTMLGRVLEGGSFL